MTEDFKRTLGDGWRVSEPYKEQKQAKFVRLMVEELSAIPREIRRAPAHFNGKPVSELSAEEREQFIFSMQQPSTQQALTLQKTRKPEDDLEWLLRPMPDCIANPEATNLDELTNNRPRASSDFLHQGKGGFKHGTSSLSSMDTDKRDRGIHAFTYSKPADPSVNELKRLKKISPMDAVQPEEKPKQKQELKLSLSTRIAFWLHDKTGIWWW